MRLRAIILLILLVKAGVTTGFCTENCHSDDAKANLTEVSCTHDESTEIRETPDQKRSSENHHSENGKCTCSCCHIASFVTSIDECAKEIDGIKSYLLPSPNYHWTNLPHSVFRPPC
ncbi:MAG: hypothetical protein R3275_06355 [Saprospiraceae bacterium]|nr:hypothetical protein [Saprospiraceae bacterium]